LRKAHDAPQVYQSSFHKDRGLNQASGQMPWVIRSAQPTPVTLWSSMHQAFPPACELPFLIAPLACFAACFEEAGGYSLPLCHDLSRGGFNPCARNASMDGCVNSATGP